MNRILAAGVLAATTVSTAAFAGTSLCSQQTFNTNQVQNCGFETGDTTGWTVGGAAAAYAQATQYGVDNLDPNSGGYEFYAGPEGATPGTSGGTAGALELSQGFTFEANRTYQISFYITNDTTPTTGYTNFFEATFDGAILGTAITGASAFGYTEETYTVTTLAGLNTLAFYFQNDAGYWDLDDVSILEIPEPASLAMFGLGAAGLLAFARRRTV